MSISVLIPTYLRPENLRQCLTSIHSSRIPASEVIVGDDGGDDETKAICDQFRDMLPMVYLKPNSNKGSLARNLSRLLTAASSEWCYLIHDDDFMVGDHAGIGEHLTSEVDFIFTDHWISMENGSIDESESEKNSECYKRDKLTPGDQIDPVSLVANQSYCLDGFYARRDFLIKNPPDEKYGGTADFFWLADVVLSHPRPKMRYRSDRTFAYRLSSGGLTAKGLDLENLMTIHSDLANKHPEYHDCGTTKVSSLALTMAKRSLKKFDLWEMDKFLNRCKIKTSAKMRTEYFVLKTLCIPISFLTKKQTVA